MLFIFNFEFFVVIWWRDYFSLWRNCMCLGWTVKQSMIVVSLSAWACWRDWWANMLRDIAICRLIYAHCVTIFNIDLKVSGSILLTARCCHISKRIFLLVLIYLALLDLIAIWALSLARWSDHFSYWGVFLCYLAIKFDVRWTDCLDYFFLV